MFPIASATTAFLSEPARVGDRHTMPARSSFVGGISSREIGLPGIMSATLGVSLAGPNPWHLSPKVTNILQNQISSLLLWNIWSIASYQFVLKPLTNPYNRDPAPYKQHCSTSLITKILLILLTEPDNPLLCHYFYYLKWVYDNEMSTFGNTLNCSYGRRKLVIYIPSEIRE